MLMEGDFYLNSMQRYGDSLKEVLKQTMLNQDITFRNQVNELHRLYRMQRILMDDFGRRKSDGNNLQKVQEEVTLEPISNLLRYEPPEKDKTFSRISTVGSTHYSDNEKLEEHRDLSCFVLKRRTLDLQLSANHNVNYIGDEFLDKEKYQDSPKELKHYFHAHNVSSPDEVKLSLSMGGYPGKSSDGKNINYLSRNDIDLGESTERVSNEDAEPAVSSAASIACSVAKHDSQGSGQSNECLTNDVKKSSSHWLTMSCSVDDGHANCQDHNSNKGFNGCHGDIPCNTISTEGKLFTSIEPVYLDLNKVELDDSSFYSNCSAVGYPSMDSSSCVSDGLVDKFPKGTTFRTSWSKLDINCSNETSALLREDGANPTLMDSNSNNNNSNTGARSGTFKAICRGEVSHMDIESVTFPPSENGGHSRNSENENLRLLFKFPNANYGDVAMAEENDEKSEEDIELLPPCRSQSAIPDRYGNKLPASSKFDCIFYENSSSIKTVQSGTDLGESSLPPNKFPKSPSSQVAESPSAKQDQESSDGELKHQCFNQEKEEPTEMDILIQQAAESLVHISLGSPSSNPIGFTEARLKEIENKVAEQPQHSSDSFESIVLKLTQDAADDNCVSSKPFEENEMGRGDWGIKLKRGRRLKDFQKDVLPGLASLSRHEICEDINIMEGVLRSREYKKMRSRMTDGGTWFSPFRGRRSRLNYVGRRHYS